MTRVKFSALGAMGEGFGTAAYAGAGDTLAEAADRTGAPAEPETGGAFVTAAAEACPGTGAAAFVGGAAVAEAGTGDAFVAGGAATAGPDTSDALVAGVATAGSATKLEMTGGCGGEATPGRCDCADAW